MLKAVIAFVLCDKCKELFVFNLADLDINEFMITLDKQGWMFRQCHVCPGCKKKLSELRVYE